MHWFYLAVAGFFEICWAVGLKYSNGFTRLAPTVFTLITMGASIFFLARALKIIPLGTGYAMWTGIGAVGTALFGIVMLAEPATLPRLACIGLIIIGLVGLKIVSS